MGARRIRPLGDDEVTIHLDGSELPARAGEPVTAALLAAGVEIVGRSSKYHRPRGAPCGDGHCFHCIARVDGEPNVRTCRARCREGLTVERQNTLGSAERDLLAATDWMFPRGLDHHEMFTGVPLVQPMVQRIVRKLTGLGRLPDAIAAASGGGRHATDVLVVGAGSAGAAAARAAAEAGARVLVVEAGAEPGGRPRSGLHPERARPEPRATYWTNAAVCWVEPHARGWMGVVARTDGLHRVNARSVVFACGAYSTPGLFENNDLPGILDAEQAASLVHRWGILPGEDAVLVADEETGDALARLFTESGGRIARRLPARAALGDPDSPVRLVGARGRRSVRAVVVAEGESETEIGADVLVLDLPRAPAYELAAAAGARTRFDPESGGFAVVANADGATDAPGVFAAGAILGASAPVASAKRGALAGSAAARWALHPTEATEDPHAS